LSLPLLIGPQITGPGVPGLRSRYQYYGGLQKMISFSGIGGRTRKDDWHKVQRTGTLVPTRIPASHRWRIVGPAQYLTHTLSLSLSHTHTHTHTLLGTRCQNNIHRVAKRKAFCHHSPAIPVWGYGGRQPLPSTHAVMSQFGLVMSRPWPSRRRSQCQCREHQMRSHHQTPCQRIPPPPPRAPQLPALAQTRRRRARS